MQYEIKIRKLEEIIKQKDFEIIALKQKLNNFSNTNFINMNPMLMNTKENPMNIRMDNINKTRKEISITIISENDKFIAKCFEEDNSFILREKYNLKGVLTFNYKPIELNLTLKENGIYGGFTVYIRPFIIRICFTNYLGQKNVISLSDDCPLEMAIIYYFIKIKREGLILKSFDGIEELVFLYNAQRLKILDRSPIKNILKFNHNPCVTVIRNKDLIGD